MSHREAEMTGLRKPFHFWVRARSSFIKSPAGHSYFHPLLGHSDKRDFEDGMEGVCSPLEVLTDFD